MPEGKEKTRYVPQLLPRETRSSCDKHKQLIGEMMVLLPSTAGE